MARQFRSNRPPIPIFVPTAIPIRSRTPFRDEAGRPRRLPKARQARSDAPVILIFDYGDDETRRRAAADGAARLFARPIDFPELRRAIDEHLADTGEHGVTETIFG